MKPPPKPIRRLVLAPGMVLGVLIGNLVLPFTVIAAAFLSRFVPGRWRILRIVWFLYLYTLIEVAALLAMFGLWVASGFGWKIRSQRFVDLHYRLMAWMLRRVVASGRLTFRLRFIREGTPPSTRGRRPIMVLSRHAGPGDSILLMDGLANEFGRRPRIVLKDFLQWDPMIDVLLNRLPCAFVSSGSEGRQELLERIGQLSAGMGNEDAFVIFPEGANYTIKRALRSIEKLREIGRPDLAERAEELRNTLPPRTTGVSVALEHAPENTDVFMVGHAGLEGFLTPGDIWRAMPTHTKIKSRVWSLPAEQVPGPEELEAWLFESWSEIDGWITDKLEETHEPFDDPTYY